MRSALTVASLLAVAAGGAVRTPGVRLMPEPGDGGAAGEPLPEHKIPAYHNGKRLRRPKSARRLKLRRTRGWR